MTRDISKMLGRLSFYTAVAMSIFHLYTAGFRLYPHYQQRSLHLAFVLLLLFLTQPFKKRAAEDIDGNNKPGGIFDLVLGVLGASTGIYLFFQFEALAFRVGSPNIWDMVLGISLLVIVLEGCRRMLGMPMVVISLVSLLYAFFGDRLPVFVAHSGYKIERIIQQVALGTEGIFGIPLGVSATQVVIFVIYGAFLEQSGAGQVFIDLAMGLFGKTRGGPAKAAIGASSLFGSISGSQVANVVSTGVFTIPLMKRVGYEPAFAGGVEAAASTGGMFLPPVMGATAFLIAEMLRVQYIDVAIAAILPACLYYVALFIMVDLRSAKSGLQGLTAEELPDVKKLLKEDGHLLIPVVVLVGFLFIAKVTPGKAAFWAIVSVPLCCLLRRRTWMSISSIITALERGAQTSLIVGIACATAGIITGVINLTGLGLRFSGMMISLAGGNLILLLLIMMIASIILGMGLPPVAAYIVLAVVGAPALADLGVNPMAAHLFLFFFGTLSAITPPVAVAAYAAAGLAKAEPFKTGLNACRLALAAFIIPFQFVFGTELIMQGNPLSIVFSIVSSLIGVAALACSLEGYLFNPLNLLKRGLLFVAALLCIAVGATTDLWGYLIIIALVLFEWQRRKKKQNQITV